MQLSRRLSLSSIGAAVLALGVLLSGCGASPTVAGRPLTSKATATPSPTATAPARTATPASSTWGVPVLSGCPLVADTPTQPRHIAVGALNISIPNRVSDYPSALLPNDAPSAPYQVPLTTSEAEQAGLFHPNPAVNPSLLSGYGFQVCNQTGASHTLTSLSVTIAGFTPSSGPVNVWHLCSGGPYNAATRQTTTGCGGGMGEVVFLAATLPADHTGAAAPATVNAQVDADGPHLPIAIGPNQSVGLVVAVNGLTSQGTYALIFGISVDGAAPTYLSPSDGSFLIAPSAVVWTGTACQTPAMQTRIPSASQDTYYVCPPAS